MTADTHADVSDALRLLLARGTTPIIVRSPPGAGKTSLVAMAATHSAAHGERVCAVTATNNQAGELATRAAKSPDARVILLLGHAARIPSTAASAIDNATVRVARALTDIPHGPVIVVSSSAKWLYHPHAPRPPYDLLILEEAYMQPWHSTFPLANLARRHLTVGDPGQTTPFTTADDRRWRGQPQSPLTPAAEALTRLHPDAPVLRLTTSLRLPADTCEVLQPLYPDLPFTGLAARGQRTLTAHKPPEPLASSFLQLLHGRSIAAVNVPGTGRDPLDPDLCEQAGDLARELHEAALTTSDERTGRPARPATLAVVCARTQQVANVRTRLTGHAAGTLTVDTANRLQGLEFDVVIAVDPLAGHRSLGPFQLEPGRLSVMASRHRVACGYLTRDTVSETLAQHVPSSDRALGHDPDPEHQGWLAHTRFRAHLLR